MTTAPAPVPDDLAALLATPGTATLATLRRSGIPQLSVVTYAWYPDEDGRAIVRVSTTDGRAKVANLRRDPRASLLVERGWAYAAVEGRVELSPVSAGPHDETVEELVRLYRDASGEHPDWDDYRRAMVTDRRLVVRLVVDRAYGMAG
jgi:PPOX class probable F420-dependent enzyme